MPIETMHRLRCQDCDNSTGYFDGALYTRKMFLAECRMDGWYAPRSGRNAGIVLCPACRLLAVANAATAERQAA